MHNDLLDKESQWQYVLFFIGERSSLTRWTNEHSRNYQTSEVDEFTDFFNNLCMVENHINLLCQGWYSTNIEVILSLLSEHNIEAPLWTKLPNQVNRIPNQLHNSVPTGRKGCSVLSFSPDGRFVKGFFLSSNTSASNNLKNSHSQII